MIKLKNSLYITTFIIFSVATNILAQENPMYFPTTFGDKISLWDDRLDASNMYGLGMETHTLYFKSAVNYRWYIGRNANGGNNDVMQLTNNGLDLMNGRLHVNKFNGVNQRASLRVWGTDANGNGKGGSLVSGNADAASFGNYNLGIESWKGIGFISSQNGKAGIIFNPRTASAFFEGKVGVGTDVPKSKLSVKGNIAISSSSIPMGLTSEVGGYTPLLNLGLNFRSEGKDNNYLGAALRIDSRNGQYPLFQWHYRAPSSTTSTQIMSLTKEGRLGIGKNNPDYLLDIESSSNPSIRVRHKNEGSSWGLKLLQKDDLSGYIVMPGRDLQITSGWNQKIILGTSEYDTHRGGVVIPWGKVGIGTQDPKNKLSVNGTIWAKKVKVTLEDAADWVFEEDYELRSLEEVEAHITEHKHLPDMPSAEEFRENDLDVAEMDNRLLQKIEELTLYLIEQNKDIQLLKKENQELKKLINSKE